MEDFSQIADAWFGHKPGRTASSVLETGDFATVDPQVSVDPDAIELATEAATAAIQAGPSGTVTIATTTTAKDVTFSPDGQYLYLSSGGSILVYGSSSGQLLTSWSIGSNLGAIDLSSDGRYLAAVERTAGPTINNQTDYYVYRLDTVTGATQRFTNHASGGDGSFVDISYLASGQVLMTQTYSGSGWEPLTTLDFSTGIFARSGSYSQDGTLNATPDRRFVAFTPHNISDAPIFYYRSGTGVTASHQGYQDNVSGFNSGVQAISPSGNLVAEGINLNIYNSSLQLQVSLTTLYPELSNEIGLAFSPDGTKLYMLNSSRSTIYALSVSDWSLVAGYQIHVAANSVNGYGDTLVASADGRYLSVIGSTGVEILDLTQVLSAPGTANADVLSEPGNGYVYGFAGNDAISASGNVQVIRAGAGDDSITLTSPATTSGSYQIIDAGSGDDTLDVSAIPGATVSSIAGGFGLGAGGGKTFKVTGVEHLQFGSDNNTIAFSSTDFSALEVRGGGGNDTFQAGPNMALRGEAGDDVFYLTPGTSPPATQGTIDGGAGIDRLEVSSGMYVNLTTGTAGLGFAQYSISGVENVNVIVGAMSMQAVGDAADNAFTVNSYRDDGVTGIVFYGMGGSDTLSGSAGNDFLYGGFSSSGAPQPGDGADYLDGRGGNDIIRGGDGNDTLMGGAGDDNLRGDAGNDTIDGGDGFDFVSYRYDDLAGPVSVDMTGLISGMNTVGDGRGGTDTVSNVEWLGLTGSNDSDTLLGSLTLKNQIFGNAGNDTIAGGAQADDLYGDDGNDTIDGRAGANTLSGDAGNDRLIVGSGADGTVVDGGADTDTLVVTGVVSLGGLAGIEAIEFQSGAALTLTGSQFTNGLTSNATLSGSGSLTINMGAGDSELYLQQLVSAGGSNVTITVNGTANDDVVKGALGSANAITGGDGFDFLRGGQLVDSISGGAGDDKITGIGGGDTLTGGAGSDQFRYFSVSDSTFGAGSDHITDFVAGTDLIDFRVFDTDPGAPGYQTPAYIGSAAFTNTGTAQVHWLTSGANILVEVDTDGNGIADMQIVLDNAAGQTLTAGDFML